MNHNHECTVVSTAFVTVCAAAWQFGNLAPPSQKSTVPSPLDRQSGSLIGLFERHRLLVGRLQFRQLLNCSGTILHRLNLCHSTGITSARIANTAASLPWPRSFHRRNRASRACPSSPSQQDPLPLLRLPAAHLHAMTLLLMLLLRQRLSQVTHLSDHNLH